MSALAVSFNEIQLNVESDPKHTFLMPTKEVAKGYGITEQNVRNQKMRHKDELKEGEHFILIAEKSPSVTKSNAGQNPIRKALWTKLGVIYLGFFIKSERAKQFRKFAADLVLDTLEKKPGRKALGKGLELEETPAVPALQIPKGLQIMTVPSDSMSSEYHVGETIFFDPRKTKGDGVFVIRIGNMVDIRRIQYFIDRNLIGLKRSNPLYRDVDLFEPSTPHLTILGMIVGKIQRGYM